MLGLSNVAAIEGARQIGFTVISISLSLVAVFIPVLLMGGVIGRILNEFAIVVTVAILASAFVSLTLTPMLAARLPARTDGQEKARWLQHLDLAFSRDQAEKRYVQALLREQHERLRAWLAEGAAIYVCGSLQGMAGGVDAVLRELLGDETVDDLVEEGRYRRDVY